MKIQYIILIIFCASLSIDAQVHVNGYFRKDGTYVQPHYRSSPNKSTYDNYSTKGNINPYTGKVGTKNPTPTYSTSTTSSYTPSSSYTTSASRQTNAKSTTINKNQNTVSAKLSKATYIEECDVVNFYKTIEAKYDTKAVNSYGDVIEIDEILVPTNNVKDGRYSVTLTRTDYDFYKVDGTNIVIETSSCYEYAYVEDAILIVESIGSIKYGKVIFYYE